MRVVVQRVSHASVTVGDEVIAEIGRGMLLLVGMAPGDGVPVLSWMAHKIASLRIFEDAGGLMNTALRDVAGQVLAVPQFTLLGDCRKGARPSFAGALRPEEARPLFERFVALLAEQAGPVATGRFGATMEVRLVNDGPVTLIIEHATQA